MRYNIKGLVLETVSEVLLEGRLEDVKAKYDENFADIIDDLSSNDPSGNNKYLDWMANQYFNVGGVSVTNLSDFINRYHNLLPKINPKMAKEIVDANTNLYPGNDTRRVSNNPKDINSFSTLAGLTKIVELAEENIPSSTERDKIYQDEKWTVIIPKTHKSSCKYGVHSSWCVSTSNEDYFHRYTKEGMLAFVLWRSKQETQMDLEREGEYKVAVHINYNNPEYTSWSWFNKQDNRMDNDLILSIFPPDLISSIKNQINIQMKNSGYLLDVDFKEIEQKAYVLSISGVEGNNLSYSFIPKKEFGLEWIKKYDKTSDFDLSNDTFKRYLPIFNVSEPKGQLVNLSIDLSQMYHRIVETSYWNQNDSNYIKFKNNLPYNIRNHGIIDENKLEELWGYFKTYFTENFDDYLLVTSDKLRVGDEISWDRRSRQDQRIYGPRIGKIIRQTPSGFFIIDIIGEDKPARFNPESSKLLRKKFNFENLDLVF